MTSIDDLPNDEGMEDRTAILVVTCERFKQVWAPFFILFRRFWSDCPYKVYLGTDKGSYPGVETIQCGEDKSWSTNVIRILHEINAERIMMFVEDFIIKAPVDTDRVRRLVRHAYDHDIGYLRLCPCPGPSGDVWPRADELGTISMDDDYRCSLQLAIWDKTLLLSLLKEGESPWDMEANGAVRSRSVTKPFLSLWRKSEEVPGGPIQYVITAVVSGKWHEDGLALLKRENIPMDSITERIP